MRVPIYPNDLQPRGSFKRLAGFLKKKWPGHHPIQQALANEILSKGLGYLSYFQVRNTSLTCHPKAPRPSEADARAHIAAEISSALNQSNDTSVPRSTVDRFVDALPLNALSAYKKAGSPTIPKFSTEHFKVDLAGNQICPVSDERPAAHVSNYTCPAPVQVPVPTISFKRSRLPRKPAKSVPQSYIDAISKVVESSGNLRHQSLLALLETGVRWHEIAGAKVLRIHNLDTSPPFSLDVKKSRMPLPVPDVAVVRRYIASEGLTPGDYLFPSQNDRTQPMRESELFNTWRSWEASAGLPSENLTPTHIRIAFTHRNLQSAMDLAEKKVIATKLGHDSKAMSAHYTVDPKGVHVIRKDNS
ncbi:TPA: tyrosine-type recombinase/integrase [Pseudomonas aeruginosa]|nr:tyrosine-type recombinase/integrase [Pseudomonas aeruginosa]